MWLAKARNFILRERLYVLLLAFIASVNIALFLTGEKIKEDYKGKEAKSVFQKKDFTKEELTQLLKTNRPLGRIVSLFSIAALFAVGAGLFLDFIILILRREGGILIFSTLPHKEAAWGLWDVCKAAILFVWFNYVLVFMESGISAILPFLKADGNLRSVMNATIADLLLFVFIIYFVIYEHREKVVSLGLTCRNFLKNIFYGIAGYLAAIPILLTALIFIVFLSRWLRYEPPMQPVLEIFLEEKKRPLVMYLTVFVAVFGPIAEETFFRGFMYKAVRSRFGFKAALFSTSAIFALLHANLAGFLPIMILGMLLAYLFEKTGTLVAPCAVHILHNTAMVALVFLMKGVLQ